jgi:hypothetical protein
MEAAPLQAVAASGPAPLRLARAASEWQEF